MSNPYRVPRPHPIDPESLGEGWSLDDLFQPDSLMGHLESNREWLSYDEHTTRDIYRTIFRRVDPHGQRITEALPYINEAMFDMGFKTVGDKPHPVSPTWKWIEAA